MQIARNMPYYQDKHIFFWEDLRRKNQPGLLGMFLLKIPLFASPTAKNRNCLRVGICFIQPLPGLPGFCHLLRVVGNTIPPYIKDKGRSARETASSGWQIAAQKECLFGASRRFLGRAKSGTLLICHLWACPDHVHSKCQVVTFRFAP